MYIHAPFVTKSFDNLGGVGFTNFYEFSPYSVYPHPVLRSFLPHFTFVGGGVFLAADWHCPRAGDIHEQQHEWRGVMVDWSELVGAAVECSEHGD